MNEIMNFLSRIIYAANGAVGIVSLAIGQSFISILNLTVFFYGLRMLLKDD